MLVAVRHVERRRIITEPECRRAWLPNRPAARVRTEAPWRSRHTSCRRGRWSNAFDCCGNVGARARTKEAWCPQASGRAAGAAHAADAGELPVRIGDGRAGRSRRCALPTTAFFEMPIRRPISAVECPSDQSCRNLRIRRPSIRIRNSCCASGSPAAAISSEPRLAACRRCAGQGRASARLDPCAARTPAGTVVAFVKGRVIAEYRAIGEATKPQTLTGTISPNGIVRLRVGVSQITGTPGSCGWSLQFRSVA